MTAIPKNPPLRDRKYLDWLRTQPCILTGLHATEADAVDPMHIGTAGRGIKSPDDEAIPVMHFLHVGAHSMGEMAMFRQHMPDWLLRECLRAYARQCYQQWKTEQ